ncbi:MAG: hypothetical protein RBR87_16425, partial [Bacteroidales bacterium]|nr:hypothetical protein [Bacteroidales bacterium]
MKTKFLISLLIAFFTVAVLPAQINVDVKNKLNRKANQRANRKTDQAIDKGFDELEDGIGSLFSKKKKKNKKDKNNLESSNAENSEQENKQDFGDFTYLFPANGNAVAVPIHCSWVLPDMENPTFTVYLEGDDWSDWLTKTTQDNEVFFDNLPTAATNFRWRVVAEAAGEKTASPWQSFSITDGTDESATTAKNETQTSKPKVVWAKFDFVPGDEVIFEDAPSADEENGEFPSRWDLHEGGAEVAEFNGTPVIMFLDDGGSIIPYLK